MLIFSAFFISETSCQEYNSAMGLRITTNLSDGIGYQWSGKIYVAEKSALAGYIGLISKEPKVSAVGAGISYQQHVNLMDVDRLFLFYGFGLRGFLGDITGAGAGPLGGLTYTLGESYNVEIEFHPNYLIGVRDKMTEESKFFDPRIGICFRYISK